MWSLLFVAAQAETLVVEVAGCQTTQGQVVGDLFDKADGYPMDAEQARARATATVTGGRATLRFEGLAAGTYALSVWHDENTNGKVDLKWFVLPAEALGASNAAKGRMGPPSFEDAAFPVTGAETRHAITVQYL